MTGGPGNRFRKSLLVPKLQLGNPPPRSSRSYSRPTGSRSFQGSVPKPELGNRRKDTGFPPGSAVGMTILVVLPQFTRSHVGHNRPEKLCPPLRSAAFSTSFPAARMRIRILFPCPGGETTPKHGTSQANVRSSKSSFPQHSLCPFLRKPPTAVRAGCPGSGLPGQPEKRNTSLRRAVASFLYKCFQAV
jgi:hypothetical protein